MISFFGKSQQNVLVIGNVDSFCFTTDSSFIVSDSLPNVLDSFATIMLFSGSRSRLNDTQIEQLLNYTNDGGGLYVGAENEPLQAESNQITKKLYNKVSYGNYSSDTAELASDGNLSLEELENVPAGLSTVAFPLDYRLKVEAWIDDEPLILSGHLGVGRIVIDGGYSRFYCVNANENSEYMLNRIVEFLMKEE
jgi:hypothetical protein